MTHANLRVSGSTFRMVSRASRAALALGFLVAGTMLVSGCASSGLNFSSPACTLMQSQIKEKQKLDAQVKALAKDARAFRKQGDTASAVSAEHRLEGLVENQRLLKDALDQTSRDCSPGMKDAEPPLDPALRERYRLEGK